MRARSVVGTVAVAALFLTLSACGTGLLPEPRATQPVLGYWVVPDQPDAIGVQFSGCDARPPMVVDETADQVRIEIADGGGCEPLHHLILELDAPLAGRTVIDGSNGEPVRQVEADGD